MTKRLFNLILFLILFQLTAFGQNTQSPAEKFLVFLNDYHRDSLQDLLTDDFQLTRTYTTYSNDKTSFLEKYLPNSRTYNGKFKILKVISEVEPKQFLVEDQSDYLKYLNVDYPTWKITIISEDIRVKQVTIDTTDTYQKYSVDIKIADEKFMAWLKFIFPGDTQEMLLNQEGHLSKRLKEYAEKQK